MIMIVATHDVLNNKKSEMIMTVAIHDVWNNKKWNDYDRRNTWFLKQQKSEMIMIVAIHDFWNNKPKTHNSRNTIFLKYKLWIANHKYSVSTQPDN